MKLLCLCHEQSKVCSLDYTFSSTVDAIESDQNVKTDDGGRGENSAKGDIHVAECSSVSAAFPEETLMEQQIDFNNPAVSSECESLESSNMNIKSGKSVDKPARLLQFADE